MSVSLEAFGIDQLTVADRLELIERIWDSLPEQVSAQDIPEWHRAELKIRRARAETDAKAGRPWREVLDAIKDDA